MNYPWAVVEAKVVCVETWIRGPGEGYGHEVGPVKDNIYTIEWVGIGAYGEVSLRLKELYNPEMAYTLPEGKRELWRPSFRASRFKPLEKKKLPDALTSLLTNPRKVIMKDQFDKQGIDA